MARPLGEQGKKDDPWVVLSDRDRDPELARIRDIVDAPPPVKPTQDTPKAPSVDPEVARDRRVRILAVLLAAGLGAASTWAGLQRDGDHDGESALAEAVLSLFSEPPPAEPPPEEAGACPDQYDLPGGSVLMVAELADGGRVRSRLTLREGRRHHVVCTPKACTASDEGPSGFAEANIRFLRGFTEGKIATAGGWICVRPKSSEVEQL